MKNNKKKGFTLMELLIVIAIIVILVAIAIPTFTAQLAKAHEATDVANARSWYAQQITDNMSEDKALPTVGATVPGMTAGEGKVTSVKPFTVEYKGTSSGNTTTFGG